MDSGSNSSPNMSVGNPPDSSADQNTQELAIAVNLLWSTVNKIQDKLGALAILTKTGEIDGVDCFIIALPKDRWQFVEGQPIPKELAISDGG